jgi:hypothetical protein
LIDCLLDLLCLLGSTGGSSGGATDGLSERLLTAEDDEQQANDSVTDRVDKVGECRDVENVDVISVGVAEVIGHTQSLQL